jgi:hypothetical protein
MIDQTTTLVSQENSVRWWVAGQIIYMAIQEGITPVTADWRLHQVIGLIHSCPTPRVHLMIEVYPGCPLPNVFYPVSRRLIAQPRRGWVTTIVHYPPWQRNILNLFTRLTYLRYEFCSSRQAALQTLQTHDSSLPHLEDKEEQN